MSERAQAGVRVRLLIDALGGRLIENGLVDQMDRAGVQVEWFRKPLLKSPFKSNHRLHRKVCVVDGRIGFTGGVGIAEEWCGDARDESEWRDTHLRVEGPAVDGLQSAFIQDWAESGRPLYGDDDEFPVQPQDGVVDGAGRARLGQPRLGRHAVGVPRHARVGPRAAADRHGVLRARRRLPRHAVRRARARRRGRPAAARSARRQAGVAADQRGCLRAAGRLRREGLDLPAVDDAREGDDGRRGRRGRGLLELQPPLPRPRRGGRAHRARPRPAARLDADLDDDFSRSEEIDLTRWRDRCAAQRAMEKAGRPIRRWM